MRKALLVGAAAWLAISGPARAQQASLFRGSFSSTKIQNVTIVDKSPLVAPIANQPRKPTFMDKVLGNLRRFMKPTLGANPVAEVRTSPRLSSPVSQSTFQPEAPFFNGQ